VRFDALGLRNRRSVPWSNVPLESFDGFRTTILGAAADGWRLIAFFGVPEEDGTTRLTAILAADDRGELGATSTRVRGRYPALTPDHPPAHLFEREIAEQCGVTPEGHPWLKPVRRHPPDHLPPGSGPPGPRPEHPFFRVEGAEVHEVAVGPVHAGVIEPGHFRFQAHGEEVLFLEIALGYQHRGVERLLETVDRRRATLVAESIAGDTVIGHAEAWCGALEALARCHKSPRAQAIRGCALELERLANHIGDLGALAGDVAFAPGAAFFGRLRGECLNLLMTIAGNRFGRGLVRPGGAGFDIPAAMAAEARERLETLRAEFLQVADVMLENGSVQGRFEGIGRVSREDCAALGCVGPTARASGVARDVRHDHPYGIFRYAQIPVATAPTGDVAARAVVRRLEVERSFEFVIEQLAALPRGEVRAHVAERLVPGELAVALVEGWRGEIVHVALTDGAGTVRRWKVKDPSFHNWSALAAALPGNAISDFPLCNKSFNLSYAGHDL